MSLTDVMRYCRLRRDVCAVVVLLALYSPRLLAASADLSQVHVNAAHSIFLQALPYNDTYTVSRRLLRSLASTQQKLRVFSTKWRYRAWAAEAVSQRLSLTNARDLTDLVTSTRVDLQPDSGDRFSVFINGRCMTALAHQPMPGLLAPSIAALPQARVAARRDLSQHLSEGPLIVIDDSAADDLRIPMGTGTHVYLSASPKRRVELCIKNGGPHADTGTSTVEQHILQLDRSRLSDPRNKLRRRPDALLLMHDSLSSDQIVDRIRSDLERERSVRSPAKNPFPLVDDAARQFRRVWGHPVMQRITSDVLSQVSEPDSAHAIATLKRDGLRDAAFFIDGVSPQIDFRPDTFGQLRGEFNATVLDGRLSASQAIHLYGPQLTTEMERIDAALQKMYPGRTIWSVEGGSGVIRADPETQGPWVRPGMHPADIARWASGGSCLGAAACASPSVVINHTHKLIFDGESEPTSMGPWLDALRRRLARHRWGDINDSVVFSTQLVPDVNELAHDLGIRDAHIFNERPYFHVCATYPDGRREALTLIRTRLEQRLPSMLTRIVPASIGYRSRFDAGRVPRGIYSWRDQLEYFALPEDKLLRFIPEWRLREMVESRIGATVRFHRAGLGIEGW